MYQNSKMVHKTLFMTREIQAWLRNYEMCTFTEFTSFTRIYLLLDNLSQIHEQENKKLSLEKNRRKAFSLQQLDSKWIIPISIFSAQLSHYSESRKQVTFCDIYKYLSNFKYALNCSIVLTYSPQYENANIANSVLGVPFKISKTNEISNLGMQSFYAN